MTYNRCIGRLDMKTSNSRCHVEEAIDSSTMPHPQSKSHLFNVHSQAFLYSFELADHNRLSRMPFVPACHVGSGVIMIFQCCSPPLSFSSSMMCLSSSSRCWRWTLSLSLSFLKLCMPSAAKRIYQRPKTYLSISFSRINLFSAAASRFVNESL